MTRRRQIANAMRKCARLAQEHQNEMARLNELLDEEYGHGAYDKFESHLDGDADFVEPLNYGGTPPTLEWLDKTMAEINEEEEDDQ